MLPPRNPAQRMSGGLEARGAYRHVPLDSVFSRAPIRIVTCQNTLHSTVLDDKYAIGFCQARSPAQHHNILVSQCDAVPVVH